MDDTTPYRYAEKDLLTERYHYMYTPYEGPGFLRAYLMQRQALCDRLERTRERLMTQVSAETELAEALRRAILYGTAREGTEPLFQHASKVLPAQPGMVEFETRSLLLDLWCAYLYAPERAAQECLAWINLLIGKFEVSKRLYAGYTMTLKPSSGKYDMTENYALLALLLMYLYQQTPSLKYLNTVLKLTDLLSSIAPDELDSVTQLYLLATVESEVAAVGSLLTKHQVML